MIDRVYKLYASSEDEWHLWMHSFRWIIEHNHFGLWVGPKPYYINQMKAMLEHFKGLSEAQKKIITHTPEKLITRLENLISQKRQPIDGDTKTTFELWKRISAEIAPSVLKKYKVDSMVLQTTLTTTRTEEVAATPKVKPPVTKEAFL